MVYLRLFFIFLTLSLFGCSTTTSIHPTDVAANSWISDGSISLSSSLPAPASLLKHPKILAFLPTFASRTGKWLAIDKNEKAIKLMNGTEVEFSVPGEGIENLTPGSFQLAHKQKEALWYAPDSYFVNRQLEVPPEGDTSRFRRGALGQYVLFLDKQTPIYDSPILTPEIGGVRVPSEMLSKIYYSLNFGAVIEVL